MIIVFVIFILLQTLKVPGQAKVTDEELDRYELDALEHESVQESNGYPTG
jgi:hypothetical protein